MLNVGLIVVLVLAAVLIYAFVTRVTTPTPDPRRMEATPNLLGDVIQLQVLNGTEVAGAAAQLTQHLRHLGFDVIEVETNEDQTILKTVILDRVGNFDAAQQVALAIGVSDDRISEELKPDYFFDAKIIIGADYASIKPFVDMPGARSDSTEEPEDLSEENEL